MVTMLSTSTLNLSLRYGHVILVTLAYMEEWTYGQAVDDVIAKTKISRIDTLPHFLNSGAPPSAPSGRIKQSGHALYFENKRFDWF